MQGNVSAIRKISGNEYIEVESAMDMAVGHGCSVGGLVLAVLGRGQRTALQSLQAVFFGG
jgi:hypothetical protein